MEVSDVLRDRMNEPGGIGRMATVSAAAHVALFAALFLFQGRLFQRSLDAPREIMTITLGGGGGPENGGMTAMGGRPVQAETPPAAKPEPIRPPAAKVPEMVLPTKAAAKPAKPSTAAPVKNAPDDARGRTPTRGVQTAPGSAVAQTGARGAGTGLSTGAGPGAGATLDVADFCCPDYLVLMTERIKSAWDPKQGVAGLAIVRFVIQRDGRLTEAAVERESGFPAADLAALRAVVIARQLPPLPSAFPNPTLTVHLNFEYQR